MLSDSTNTIGRCPSLVLAGALASPESLAWSYAFSCCHTYKLQTGLLAEDRETVPCLPSSIGGPASAGRGIGHARVAEQTLPTLLSLRRKNLSPLHMKNTLLVKLKESTQSLQSLQSLQNLPHLLLQRDGAARVLGPGAQHKPLNFQHGA